MTDDRDKEPSIADLCRPLSARVLPKSALRTNSGHELKPSLAVRRQKAQAASSWARKREKDG